MLMHFLSMFSPLIGRSEIPSRNLHSSAGSKAAAKDVAHTPPSLVLGALGAVWKVLHRMFTSRHLSLRPISTVMRQRESIILKEGPFV